MFAEVTGVGGAAEHDHAGAEGELDVGDGVVRAFVHDVAREAEGVAAPVDLRVGVPVAKAGDNGGVRGNAPSWKRMGHDRGLGKG